MVPRPTDQILLDLVVDLAKIVLDLPDVARVKARPIRQLDGLPTHVYKRPRQSKAFAKDLEVGHRSGGVDHAMTGYDQAWGFHMDTKLCEFAGLIRSTQGLSDQERWKRLLRFTDRRDRSSAWYAQLTPAERSLWSEARAIVVVDADLPKRRPPYDWTELESLANELDASTPNRSVERWITSVRDSVFTLLRQRYGETWTKAQAQTMCQHLLEERGQYQAAYREIAEAAIERGV